MRTDINIKISDNAQVYFVNKIGLYALLSDSFIKLNHYINPLKQAKGHFNPVSLYYYYS